MTYVKKSRKNYYLALLLALILIIAAGAAAYVVLSAPKPITVGVKAGDTFTYSIKGIVNLEGEGALPSEGFERYNQTDYFKATVTDVSGTNVSLDTVWRFLNGTEITDSQNFDISAGKEGVNFWAIYPAGLQIGDLLRPHGYDETYVNNTYTKTYLSGGRETDFWFINNQFQNTYDPTGSTLMYDYRNIDFDQQTGMLVSLQNYQAFNNPQRSEEVIWTLVSSNVWDV